MSEMLFNNKTKEILKDEKIGIVILNYNSFSDTIECVNSIKLQKLSNYKIYIVDNASINNSIEILKGQFSNDLKVDIIENEVNLGFSAGNNVGFKKAIMEGCEFILCVNSDVIFKENSIKIMLSVIKSDDNCGVVGPKVYCADGSIQNCNKGILTPSILLLRKRGLRIFDWFGKEKKYTYRSYKYDKRLILDGMVSGCCFLIRSDLLRQINYLDENVFLYHEEDILGAKIRNTHKYYVCLEPSAEVIHLGGRSTSKANEFIRYHEFKSSMYYLWNYTNVGSLQYNFISFVFSFMWFFESIINHKYWKYYKQLKNDYKNIRKNGKCFVEKK